MDQTTPADLESNADLDDKRFLLRDPKGMADHKRHVKMEEEHTPGDGSGEFR